MSHSHSNDGASHSHAAADHGHTHEILDGPGSYLGRELPIIEGRDWEDRSFTIGIGGYASYTTRSSLVPTAEDRYGMHLSSTLTDIDP
jgi:hypothetical protein